VCGRGGNDRIYAGRADIVRGGSGNDIYARNGSRNIIDGGRGRDRARVDRRLDTRRSVERLF
jgi:Ca2+-binding RTX toxin-like protein